MNTPNRNYANGDADMLTACATLTEAAIAHKTFLQSKRSNWGDPYFETLKQRIADTSSSHLGMDNAKAMRAATLKIITLQKQAESDLANLKAQLEVDYRADKPRRNELLKQLGFTDQLKKVQNKDQQAMVQLLYAYKAAMTPALKAEFLANGTMPALIDNITGYADVLQQANITQETMKSGRKGITAEGIAACNSIYTEVIGVSKMASKFFKGDPAVQSRFNYNKALAAMNGGVKSAPVDTPGTGL